MKGIIASLFVFFLLTFSSCKGLATKTPLKISDIKFESIMGTTSKNTREVYCLLGSGFFKTPRSDNHDSLISDWIKTHPNAIILPISSFEPLAIDDKDSKMIYCWIIDKKDTLNNYLIRNGCFPGGTMERPKTWDEMDKREKELYQETDEKPNVEVYVNKKAYDDFIKQIIVAEFYAKENKLGIWLKDKNE